MRLVLERPSKPDLCWKYVLESGAKRVLIALPASLRKQWELELEDKFGLESVILDRLTVEKIVLTGARGSLIINLSELFLPPMIIHPS